MLDLSLLAEPMTWWLVVTFLLSFLMVFATRNIVMSIIPALAITAYMSVTGFLPMWLAWVILLVMSFAFATLVVLPVTKHLGGGMS